MSQVGRIQHRVLSIIHTQRKRSICCVFTRLTLSELETNNQLYNLIAKTSPLNKRGVRLSVCYLALLLELSLCALFFNLAPGDDEPPFLERLIENFWIALYSVVFALFPLLLLGLLFSVPKKWLAELQSADQLPEVKDKFNSISKELHLRVLVGFVFFFVLSLFLLLYIISFCHVAGLATSVDWLIASAISILLDQVAFEVLPALAVGFLGTLQGCCSRCRALLWVIVLIELYRLYRNLIQG